MICLNGFDNLDAGVPDTALVAPGLSIDSS